MATEVFNRREIKYLISQELMEKILPTINLYMDPDKYNKNGQTYSIQNLYYDTDDDYLISKSIQKPIFKQKIRLRSYGRAIPGENVYLEIKKKYKGFVNKRRTSMTLEEAYNYSENRIKPASINCEKNQIFNEIDYLFSVYPGLKPKVFLSYDRYAFYEKNNKDFRLTFDKNLLARRENLKLEEENYGESLLKNGEWILEAKAENAFPLWFVKLLSENNIKSTSFSKYGREYEKYLSEIN